MLCQWSGNEMQVSDALRVHQARRHVPALWDSSSPASCKPRTGKVLDMSGVHHFLNEVCPRSRAAPLAETSAAAGA